MVKVIKGEFVVIGKEGSSLDGEGFIQKLWNDANGHFSEVAHLVKKDTFLTFSSLQIGCANSIQPLKSPYLMG